MKILVCVKQVPDAEAPIRIADDGRSLEAGSGDWRMNRFDEFAVEEALRIREFYPGSVVETVTVGPARAAAVLRRALAMGADEALHILRDGEEDPLPGDVAAWIAVSVRDRGHDLILTGVMSEDAMHAQTGPLLAERLGIPYATAVITVRLHPETCLSGEKNTIPTTRPQPAAICVERELEGGFREALEMPLPALMTVQSGINRPRYPSLSNVLRARSQLLRTVPADELPSPPRRERAVGLAWTDPSGKALFLTGTPAKKAEHLAALFREKGLL